MTVDKSSNLSSAADEAGLAPTQPPLQETVQTVQSPLITPIHQFRTHAALGRGKIQLLKKPSSMTEEMKVRTFSKMRTGGGASVPAWRLGQSLIKKFTISAAKPPTEEVKRTRTVRSSDGIKTKLSLNFKPMPAQFRCENKNKLEERYDVLEMVGKGGFGEIRKIKDKNTGTIRALKIMQKSRCQAAKEFSDEIQILQRLVHD